MKNSIGKNIRELREKMSLSPQELADQIRISLPTIYNWEQGKSLPSTELLPQVAVALNTSIDNLMLFDTNKQLKRSFSKYYFDLDLNEYEKAHNLIKQTSISNSDESEYKLISIETTHIIHQAYELIDRINNYINEKANLDEGLLYYIQSQKILMEILYYGVYDVLDDLKLKAETNPTIESYFNLIYGYLSSGDNTTALRLCCIAMEKYQSKNLDIIFAECLWRSGKINEASETLWRILRSRNNYSCIMIISAHELLYRILLKNKDTKSILNLLTFSTAWLPDEFSKCGYDFQEAKRKFDKRLGRFKLLVKKL